MLLLGDSLLNQTAPELGRALVWHGLNADIVDESFPGTGLLDPHVVSTQIAKVNAHPSADIVVIEFSGNCVNCSATYGSPEFFRDWSANLVAIVDFVRSLHKDAVLVLPPPLRPDLGWAEVQRQLGERVARTAAEKRVVLVNWWDALVDTDGNYQQFLLYPDVFGEPTLHAVRDDDGVHLTQDGARRTAEWTASALHRFWAVSA